MLLPLAGLPNTPPVEEAGLGVEDVAELLQPDAAIAGDDLPIEAAPIEDIPSPFEEGKANPVVAGYKDPTMGPFLCANCQYYQEDESCLLVAGFIEPEGLCNLFTVLPDVVESEELAPTDAELTDEELAAVDETVIPDEEI